MRKFRTDIHSERQRRLYWAVGLLHIAAIALVGALYLLVSGTESELRILSRPVSAAADALNPTSQLFELSRSGDGMMLLAVKSTTGKLSSKKKKATKVKKRPSRVKKRRVNSSRKKSRSSTIQASRQRVTADFIEYFSIGFVGLALFGLYLRYQKEFGEASSDLKELSTAPIIRANQYEAKAVVLTEPTGPDPMTFERTDVFARVAGKSRRDSVALDLALDGPELEIGISNEIDDIISSIKIKDEKSSSESEADVPVQMLLLPAEMQGHFEGLWGEKLEWSAPLYIKGVCEGIMAITSHRILALYERRSIKFWLPSLIYQTKRNQTPLEQISLYKSVQVNRPSFLAVGATVFWWFPFGTIGACFTIACFLLLTRRELGVWTKGHKRTFPLSMVDLEEAMSSVGKLTGVQPMGRASDAHEIKKAG